MADESVLAYAPPTQGKGQATAVEVDVAEQVDRIPTEPIPTDARLFMRVHDQHIDKNGRLRPGVFRDHGGGMSTDWSKYSTALETQNRAKKPADNGVVCLVAGKVRDIKGLSVVHTPHNTTPPHPRHVDVFGEKDEEVRMRLLGIVTWEIKNKTAV